MTTRVSRTATASTNETKFTWSAWVKKTKVGAGQTLIYNYLDGNNRGYFQFDSSDRLYYYDKEGGVLGADLTSTRKFRDPSCWYHICLIGDSTDSTQGDRIKVYVNNERVAMSGTYPASSENLGFKTDTGTNYVSIGLNPDSTSNSFEGVMSHIYYVDGLAYPATTFGETDATTGEWKIKTSSGISTANYGNNGYFILKDGNSVTDQSGNSHNLTVNTGTLTKTEDCPSNVFCTMNPLSKGSDITITNGNNTITNSQSSDNSIVGTIACGNGKYFWEAKCTSNVATYSNIGITLSSKYGGNHSGVDAGRIMWSSNGNLYRTGLGLSAVSLGALGTNDIIGVALDTENGTLKFYKGGVLTHTETNTSFLYSNNEYIPASGLYGGGGWQYNFGNGYFGTTAVSSAGSNASGIGIFEYDVPSGYTALSTKGLNE